MHLNCGKKKEEVNDHRSYTPLPILQGKSSLNEVASYELFRLNLPKTKITFLCTTSSNQRLGKCVRQNIRTRKRGARQRGPKPLKKPGGAANLQSSHDTTQNFLAAHRSRPNAIKKVYYPSSSKFLFGQIGQSRLRHEK